MSAPASSPFFQMRISPEERERLRALAAEGGVSQAAVIRDLVREAIAAKRAAQLERYGPRLFGDADESPDAAA